MTREEYKEREILIGMQGNPKRPMSQEEFDKLQALHNKFRDHFGSPFEKYEPAHDITDMIRKE